MAVPEIVYKGTTFTATIVCVQNPPPTWVGELRLTRTGASDIVIAGTDGGDGKTHVFTVAAAVTATWTAAVYNWSFLVTSGATVILKQQGQLEVQAINGTVTELVAAKNNLAAAEAEMVERTTGKPQSYSIKDRSLSRMSLTELMATVSYWRRRVKELTDEQQCSETRGNRRITYGSFSQ
jgi:hypothetical protein